MNKVKKTLKKLRLALFFTMIVFFIMLISMILVLTGMYFLSVLGIRSRSPHSPGPVLLFALTSLIIGTFVSIVTSRFPLAPMRKLMDAVDRVAAGDYSVRISFRGPEEIRTMGEKFNHMAQEIGSVEMLRSDFINNFSHEFKTPIVSIRGFAKTLKWEDLTPEERNEYLDIIIEESDRLAELATNVLNLSKVEQQTILTDKKKLNLSEQIRLVIALMDSKWSCKHPNFIFDSEEVFTTGNEELLKQVWINVVDNALKFSPINGDIIIQIEQQADAVILTFSDHGIGMSEDTLSHIFEKFYQGDTSHTTKGNGIGLSLVKRIVELHDGTIHISSVLQEGTSVPITLPVGET